MTIGLETIAHLFDNAGSIKCPATFSDLVRQRLIDAPKHEDTPHNDTRFRASKVGRPWISQVLDQWFYQPNRNRQVTLGQSLSMLNGSIIQEVAAVLLDLTKFDYEAEKEVSMFNVTGHADLIVDTVDSTIVLECKSMATHLVTAFCNNPSDSFGYVSQLSFYAYCTRHLRPAKPVKQAFLVFDRSMSRFRVVPISDGLVDSKVKRIQTATKLLVPIERYDFETLFNTCVIPPALDGKIPDSLNYSRWGELLYDKDLDGAITIPPTEELVARFNAIPRPDTTPQYTQMELDL